MGDPVSYTSAGENMWVKRDSLLGKNLIYEGNIDTDELPDIVAYECNVESDSQTPLQQVPFIGPLIFKPVKEKWLDCYYEVLLTTCDAPERDDSIRVRGNSAPLKCGRFAAYYMGEDKPIRINSKQEGEFNGPVYTGCRLFVDDSHMEIRCDGLRGAEIVFAESF
ncbi:MAG: hypothetical protein HYY43_06440 [Deltaproteobacteria bacterium]|nr:hypothetical protein [Deltaproteobacteria bacterium]